MPARRPVPQKGQPPPVPQAPAAPQPAEFDNDQIVIQQASNRVGLPPGGSVTTVNNGAALEGQLEGLIRNTSVDELVKREGMGGNLRTIRESQLRELIRQAISQVISSGNSSAMDEATLDRVQEELRKAMAERQREARERGQLADRVRELEAETAELVNEREAAEQQGRTAAEELARLHEELEAQGMRLASAEGVAATLLDPLLDLDRQAWAGAHQYEARNAGAEPVDLATAVAVVPATRDHLLHLRTSLARLSPEVPGEGPAADLARVQKAQDEHKRDQKWINELQARVPLAERQARAAEAALAAERERAAALERALAQAAIEARLAQEQAAATAAAQQALLDGERARTADLERRLGQAEDTIARLEAELAARTADALRKPLPPGPSLGAFLAGPGRPRAAYLSNGRLRLATRDGGWRTHDLPATARGAANGWHREADASDHLLTVDAAGRPLEVVRTAAGRTRITPVEPAGKPVPPSADQGLSAVAVPVEDTAFAALRDAEGRVHLLRSRRGDWTVEEPAERLHAPAAAGAPVSWWWGRENSLHLTYPDAAGRLHELFELSGRWYHALLAEGSGAPPCAGFLAAHAPGASEHVWYAAADGRLHLLSYDGAWRHDAVGADAPPTGGAPSVVEHDDGTQTAFYRGTDGHVHVLEQRDGAWHHQDLTATSNAAPASDNPAAVKDGGMVLATYSGDDGLLHLLTHDGTWRHTVIGG